MCLKKVQTLPLYGVGIRLYFLTYEQVSVLFSPEYWLCQKLEGMNFSLQGGFHLDYFLKMLKSQVWWYDLPLMPQNSLKSRKSKPSGTGPFYSACCSLVQ